MTNAHATVKLLTMRTKVEKNIIIYTNKQTQYHNSVTVKKTILLIIKIKKTADNKRTFVQFVFAYWQVVVVVISRPELNMGSL